MKVMGNRIVAELRAKPRTADQLSEDLPASPHYVRACLAVLREEGRVIKGEPAPRRARKGATPHVWMAA